MSTDLLLAIDCGTQSLRALAFDGRGALGASAKVEYQPYFSSRPGWAEQDPAVWSAAMAEAISRLAYAEPTALRRLAGMAVTTQRDSMVCVDRDAAPLRSAILWLDARKATPPWRPRGVERLGLDLVGMTEPALKTQEAAACNWIMQNEPELWERTAKYLQVSGYLGALLTGGFSDSVASQIGHLPFDYRKQAWAAPSHRNAKMFPVEPDKLPSLVQPGTPIGRITRRAASIYGLPAGLPVFAAGSDKGCETIGMGVVDESVASLSFGTTATVQVTSERYLEPERFMPSYPAPVPGRFNPEFEIFRGYWMITWFRNQFAWREVAEAESRGIAPEVLLDELLKSTPPGAYGLMMQPFWTGGLKHPSAKGAIIGFGDVHERAHLYRSIIEGLGYGLRDGLCMIERVTRKKVESLAVSGGASRSDSICHISADLFNLPLSRGVTWETSGLGAAMCAASGLGWYPSVQAASAAMAGKGDTFEPDRRNAELYSELYHRVYRRMYRKLAPLYEEIRDITGYPEKAGGVT